MRITLIPFAMTVVVATNCAAQRTPTPKQLDALLDRYPAADTDGDGALSLDEALAYRKKIAPRSGDPAGDWSHLLRRKGQGIQRDFKVDPGWNEERFPDQAVCYRTPAEIAGIFRRATGGKQPSVVSFAKPKDGALRVIGIGHSFMAPGYKTLPAISKGAGMEQPLYTHLGGGMTGSARYKWEQENGIFSFEGKPLPKLLASIAGGQWDAMCFGPYYNDRPVYYCCWIDFCLKYNPDMKFYLSDAWPQLEELDEKPKSEAFFTEAVLEKMGQDKRAGYADTVDVLRDKYPGRVFVMPTSDAMVLAAIHYVRGELTGIEGIHRTIGGKERSLWKDQLGHLGPGLERLEGYVFYATLYKDSPERINGPIAFGGGGDFPSPELDQMFRKIAWQAVTQNPYAGVEQ